MQKKSLLVALFCGALCLTGCLKNEESASVAQVRIAKANELNSIADLNKAKAQAEVIYANAEATIANAEAKLREAQANLVNAQAETEKIRAELLKVRVALAEVKVDEEKVRLQMLEADLQQKLAEVEAAVAMAEAEKQGWINVLNHALADAERQAIEDAKAIIEAEDNLQEYLLTQETEKAKLAKKAANKYFKALADVQELQREQLEVQVRKALVEAGAIEIRDGIHYAIAQIDEEIAKKEALVEYLKEYQTATPEEIEEQLKEAWEALNDAYAEWGKAFAAEQTAQASFEAAEGVQSTYVDKWSDNFGDVVKRVLSILPGAGYAQYPYSLNYFVDEETGVKYNAVVIFDEEDEIKDIVPLWTANVNGSKEQYFDEPLIPAVIAGIKQPTSALSSIYNRTYYPAKIEFDNIDKLFSVYKEYQEDVVLKNFDDSVAAYTEQQREILETRVAGMKTAKKYFEDYIANPTRKAMVEKAETALEDSITNANKTHDARRKAFEAYRDYMVMTYDVDRQFFINRYNAKNESIAADADSTSYVDSELPDAIAAVNPAFAELEKAELYAHEMRGAYDKAIEAYEAAADEEEYASNLAEARKKFNDRFIVPENSNDTTWFEGNLYNTDNATHTTKVDSTKAGSTQVSVYTAEEAMNDAMESLRNAQWLAAYYAGFGDTAKAEQYASQVETMKGLYESAVNSYNEAVVAQAKAEKITKDAKELTTLAKAMSVAEKAWKDAVADLYKSSNPEKPTTYDEFVAAVRDTLTENVGPVDINLNFYPRTYTIDDIPASDIPENADPKEVAEGEAYANYTTAQKTEWFSHRASAMAESLADAEAALLAQLAAKMNVDEDEIETTEDKKADELYEAWRKAEDTGATVMRNAFWELMKVYYYCADQDHRDRRFDNEFYWANATYQVDPEHQLISGYHWDEENETYVLEYSYRRTTINEEGEEVADREHSLGGLIEDTEAILADEEQFAKDCKKAYINERDMVDPHETYAAMLKDIEKVTKNLAEYKAVEPAYVASVENRNTTHAAWVDAQIETIVAEAAYELALEEYNALKAIQDEGIWVYDPDAKIFEQVYGDEPDSDSDDDKAIRDFENGFTLVPIAKEIERLEGTTDVLHEMIGNLIFTSITEGEMPDFDEIEIEIDTQSIAGLSFAKKLLQEALKQGKLGLQVVIAAFDEELAVLDEKIQVYSAIAEKFKAVMNAYLGIVENAEGETGPLDGEGEGDDEE